jgi:hypothetical protein
MKKIVMMILPMFTAFTQLKAQFTQTVLKAKAQTVSYWDTTNVLEYAIPNNPIKYQFLVPVNNGAGEKCFIKYWIIPTDLNEEETTYVLKLKTVVDLSIHSKYMFSSPYAQYSWKPISMFIYKHKNGDIKANVEGTVANDYGTKRAISFYFDIDQNTIELESINHPPY